MTFEENRLTHRQHGTENLDVAPTGICAQWPENDPQPITDQAAAEVAYRLGGLKAVEAMFDACKRI